MNRNVTLNIAEEDDLSSIWKIINEAKAQLKLNGSLQWQDGYPTLNTIKEDINNYQGYVLKENNIILAYSAIIFNIEPAYNNIKGNWLSQQDYCVIHRMAVAAKAKNRSLGIFFIEKIEELCTKKRVFSIRVDTSYDNKAMIKTLERKNFSYCGEVNYKNYSRIAYEKVL